MKRILFVTARFPWPIVTGDALRAYNQVKELAKENLVDIFSVENRDVSNTDINDFINLSISGELSRAGKIKNIILDRGRSALQCAMYNDKHSWTRLKELLISNQYDIIVFQLVRLEYLIFKTISLREMQGFNSLIYCDYVDALSLNMKNRAKSESFIMKKICAYESKKLSVIEKRVHAAIDAGFIISERDASYIGKQDFKILPNGVDIPDVDKELKSNNELINLAFWGNMSYYPNIKAAIFLAELFAALPDNKYKLHIIGAHPSKQVQALNSIDGVTIHGYVDDLKGFLSTMDLAVFPIFDGSGLQNKVLEAFALGLPVITTDIVLDSMPKLRQYAITANSKLDFIRSINLAESDNNYREHNSHGAIEVLKKQYSWELINKVMELK